MDIKPPTFISIETTAFSGATLLTFLLGSHAEIATIGEINGLIATDDPETYLCSCGKRIRECEFWQDIESGMQVKGHDFEIANFNMKFDFGGSYLARRFREGALRQRYLDAWHDQILFRLPGEKQRFAQQVARNTAFVETILDVTGKRALLDSSKSRLRVRALRHFGGMDVRIIHLVRRVEGVVASQLKRSPQTDVEILARDWLKRHQRLLSSYQHWAAERYRFVRYEDVCLNTEAALVQLFDFLGLDSKLENLDFQTTTQHVIGNPMRLRPLSSITLDERWKDDLSLSQINRIRQIAGKLNRQFGYDE